MLARIRKSMEEKDQGFTLIELLVVMIIIGILAAIAVPVFLTQRAKARETSAKADVTTIGKEIAAYYVDGSKTLTVAGASSTAGWTLTEQGASAAFDSGKLSNGNKVLAPPSTAASATSFCVIVQSGFANDGSGTSSDKPWRYNQDGLTQSATC